MTPVEPDAVKPDAEPELPRNRDRDLPKREGDGFRETEEQGGDHTEGEHAQSPDEPRDSWPIMAD